MKISLKLSESPCVCFAGLQIERCSTFCREDLQQHETLVLTPQFIITQIRGGWSMQICIFHKLPIGADAIDSRTTVSQVWRCTLLNPASRMQRQGELGEFQVCLAHRVSKFQDN